MPPINKTEMEKKIKELEEKQAELQKLINELKQDKIEEPKKRWEPEIDEEYHFVNDCGFVSVSHWENDVTDNCRYSNGNIFKTEQEAEEYRKKLEIQAYFKNYVEERNGELDWNNSDQDKYCLYYNYFNKMIEIDNYSAYKYQGTIYSSNIKILKDAIAELGEENIKKYILEVEG